MSNWRLNSPNARLKAQCQHKVRDGLLFNTNLDGQERKHGPIHHLEA